MDSGTGGWVMRRRCSINIGVGLGVTLALLGARLRAEFVYVADVNNEVWGYTISPATGALTSIAGSPFPVGLEPGSVAVDPSGKFAYVAHYVIPDGFVSAYTINPATGVLTAIAGSPFASEPGAFSMVVDPSGKFVYVAHDIIPGGSVRGTPSTRPPGPSTPWPVRPSLREAIPLPYQTTRPTNLPAWRMGSGGR